MPNTRSAAKHMRQNERRRLRNRVFRTRARTFVKKTRRLLDEGRLAEAEQAAAEACRALDKAAAKGIIHRNNAARRKSRLMRHLNRARE